MKFANFSTFSFLCEDLGLLQIYFYKDCLIYCASHFNAWFAYFLVTLVACWLCVCLIIFFCVLLITKTYRPYSVDKKLYMASKISVNFANHLYKFSIKFSIFFSKTLHNIAHIFRWSRFLPSAYQSLPLILWPESCHIHVQALTINNTITLCKSIIIKSKSAVRFRKPRVGIRPMGVCFSSM